MVKRTTHVFSVTLWVIKTLYQLEPFSVTMSFIVRLVSQIIDLLNIYIFANVLGTLIDIARQQTPDLSKIYILLVIKLSSIIIQNLVDFLDNYFTQSIQLKLTPKLKQYLYTKINHLGIQTLEEPEIQNRISRAEDALSYFSDYAFQLLTIASVLIKLVIAALQLVFSYPLFLVINILCRIPAYFNDKYFRRKVWELSRDNTENTRIAANNATYLNNTTYLPEIFLNNTFKFFDHKYMGFRLPYALQHISLRKSWYSRFSILNLFSSLALFVIYAQIVLGIAAKIVTPTLGILQIRLTELVDTSLYRLISSINSIFELSIKLQDVYELFQAQPSHPDGVHTFPKLKTGPKISFSSVTFSYPRSDKKIFDNFDLVIEPGEKIAIVGENGAGKTTLVKLISRMYRPQKGVISINDFPINDIKINTLYKNLGILFQEYNEYTNLTARENILIGDLKKRPSQSKLNQAAKKADALDFIQSYPKKFDQILSERYTGGVRPSTGQWQKLALARFFYRNAPLVIFDEPTASIDAVAEARIFNRIYKSFKKKTVIIVSHRFSTVRNADRIIVLSKGQIIEQGTHSQLMTKNGSYAHSFNLQAKGYEHETN